MYLGKWQTQSTTAGMRISSEPIAQRLPHSTIPGILHEKCLSFIVNSIIELDNHDITMKIKLIKE